MPSPKTGKLLGLEWLRFFSALSVLLWHFQHFYWITGTPLKETFVRESQPLYSWFWWAYRYGHLGVQVFWCISGFIFFWKYAATIGKRSLSPWNFAVLRFSRLYPLHIVTLLAVALLQRWHFANHGGYFVYEINDLYHFVLNLFLASGWGLELGYSFNGPVWSISAEVVIYGVFFASLFLLGARFWVHGLTLLVFALAFRLNVIRNIVECGLFFFVGGLAARLHNRFHGTRTMGWIYGLAALWILGWPAVANTTSWLPEGTFSKWFLLHYTPVLIVLLAHPLTLPDFWETISEAVGNMTYSSYLLHFPLQILVGVLWPYAGPRGLTRGPALLAAFIFITLGLSWIAYRYFEMPAQDWIRRRWLRKNALDR